MKYWFGLNSEELYENSERLNSDVCFFISKTANEVHSGIHIYSEGIKDKNLRNILTDGEVIASHITEDYYLPEHGNEVDTDNFLLFKYNIKDQKNKAFVFYILYSHLLPSNYYKFYKKQNEVKYDFTDKVDRNSIAEYDVFDEIFPFYIKSEMKLTSGEDIEIVGKNIVKGCKDEVAIANQQGVMEYVLEQKSQNESFSPSSVTCRMRGENISLADVSCDKQIKKLKICKDASVYNSNNHKFAVLTEDSVLHYVGYDNEKERAKVKINGEKIEECVTGIVIIEMQEGNEKLYRIATPEIYATYCESESEKSYPPQDSLRTFLKYFYPLDEADMEDKNIKDNIFKISLKKLNSLKQTGNQNLLDILEKKLEEMTEQDFLIVNSGMIKNLKDRLKQPADSKINYFYYAGEEGAERIIELDGESFKKAVETVGKDISISEATKVKLYVSKFEENEGSGNLLHYKIKTTEKLYSNENIYRASLYISDAVEEEVYIGEGDILEVVTDATVTGTTGKKKGLLCLKENVPDSLINENTIFDSSSIDFKTVYSKYKSLIVTDNEKERTTGGNNGTIEYIKMTKDGGEYSVRINAHINLEFFVCVDENKKKCIVGIDEVIGHMAKQADREYVDISLFTFKKFAMEWYRWKIPAGTIIMKDVVIKDSGERQLLSNNSKITVKKSETYPGFSEIVSLTLRVCVYMDTNDEEKSVATLTASNVNEFTVYLTDTKFSYRNGNTICNEPDKRPVSTTLACSLLTVFFTNTDRKVSACGKIKDYNNNPLWFFEITNTEYFTENKMYIEDVTENTINISINNLPVLYGELSFREEEYKVLAEDIYMDREPVKKDGKYHFEYEGLDCFIQEKKYDKVNVLRLSDLFHPVYIDDKKKLYTSQFKFYNSQTGEFYFHKYGTIKNNFFDTSDQLRYYIRNCMIQKPLEFDSEKVNDEFINALKTAGFWAFKDERQDFWHEIKVQAEDIFGKTKNCFWFYHPVTFIDHVKNNVLFEYNPYKGKTYREVYGETEEKEFPKINGDNFTETEDFKIVDNPGFAPVYDESGNEKKDINGYARVTGFFNEDYLDVPRGELGTYRANGYEVFNHGGVDFRGRTGTKIKSLIYGTVLAYGKYSTYGRTIFVCNRERTGVYLLAHLSRYNGDILKKVEIIPGDVVGYVGDSGSADTSGNVDGRYDAHLHVSYFNIEGAISGGNIESEIVKKTGNIIERGMLYEKMSGRNPFYHESKKKPNKGGKK